MQDDYLKEKEEKNEMMADASLGAFVKVLEEEKLLPICYTPEEMEQIDKHAKAFVDSLNAAVLESEARDDKSEPAGTGSNTKVSLA